MQVLQVLIAAFVLAVAAMTAVNVISGASDTALALCQPTS